jgi:hypothetical protein
MPGTKELIDSLIHVGAITAVLIGFAMYLARREEEK